MKRRESWSEVEKVQREKMEGVKERLVAEVEKHAMFIGSRAWGFETADSDYDYLLQRKDFKAIVDELYEKFPFEMTYGSIFVTGGSPIAEAEQGFESIVVHLQDGRYINVIAPETDKAYNAWVNSAIQFSKLAGVPLFKDKYSRVEAFELLKRLYLRGGEVE